MNLCTSQRIVRSFSEPDRGDLPFEKRWQGDDSGLITCWENGRKLRNTAPELAQKAKTGELPILGWKGGIEENIKMNDELNCKYGSLYYLAVLQGLLGNDLDIEPAKEVPLLCKRTGRLVVFTGNRKKYHKNLGAGEALEICHASGKELRNTSPELASRAESGELPVLEFPGGVDAADLTSGRFGSLFYLAQWQGLRDAPWNGLTGKEKNMSTTQPIGIRCAASDMFTVFIRDATKFLSKSLVPDAEFYPPPEKAGIPKTYNSITKSNKA